jgi:site-specific recombinase XerD
MCLLDRRLSPQTINEHLIAIRSFYRYLQEEEEQKIDNPEISGLSLRFLKLLPRFL